MVIGHEWAREALERELPPVVLLRGPVSVGKWTLAMHLAHHHKVHPADSAIVTKLTMDGVRRLRGFVAVAPFGKFKLVVLRLDNTREEHQNALLKTLEEPPPTARFLLVTSGEVLPTVESRAHVYRLGLLTEDQVSQILERRFKLSPAQAATAARVSGGQVARAMTGDRSESARRIALATLKAVADRDAVALGRALKGLDLDAAEVVRRYVQYWLHEVITGDWHAFSPSETFGLDRDPMLVRRMLLALSGRADVRAKLALRVALEPLTTR